MRIASSGPCTAKMAAGGFNVLRERGGPVVTLTYETEAKAQEAHDLMAKVIAGAAITPHL